MADSAELQVLGRADGSDAISYGFRIMQTGIAFTTAILNLGAITWVAELVALVVVLRGAVLLGQGVRGRAFFESLNAGWFEPEQLPITITVIVVVAVLGVLGYAAFQAFAYGGLYGCGFQLARGNPVDIRTYVSIGWKRFRPCFSTAIVCDLIQILAIVPFVFMGFLTLRSLAGVETLSIPELLTVIRTLVGILVAGIATLLLVRFLLMYALPAAAVEEYGGLRAVLRSLAVVKRTLGDSLLYGFLYALLLIALVVVFGATQILASLQYPVLATAFGIVEVVAFFILLLLMPGLQAGRMLLYCTAVGEPVVQYPIQRPSVRKLLSDSFREFFSYLGSDIGVIAFCLMVGLFFTGVGLGWWLGGQLQITLGDLHRVVQPTTAFEPGGIAINNWRVAVGSAVSPLAPLISILNGVIVGLVAYLVAIERGGYLALVALAPHGVLELFVVFAVMSRFVALVRRLLQAIALNDPEPLAWELRGLLRMAVLAVPLLLAAALIEVLVTPLLVGAVLG